MGVSVFRVPRRLYWTADKARLVEEGDPASAFLAFPVGYELTVEEARRFRLLDTIDTPVSAAVKMADPPRNKARTRGAHKSVDGPDVVVEHDIETVSFREKA